MLRRLWEFYVWPCPSNPPYSSLSLPFSSCTPVNCALRCFHATSSPLKKGTMLCCLFGKHQSPCLWSHSEPIENSAACQTAVAPIKRPQFLVRAKSCWLVARKTLTSALFNMCSMNISIHGDTMALFSSASLLPALGCLCSRRCRPIIALDARASLSLLSMTSRLALLSLSCARGCASY